jgi:hypothetical protein
MPVRAPSSRREHAAAAERRAADDPPFPCTSIDPDIRFSPTLHPRPVDRDPAAVAIPPQYHPTGPSKMTWIGS